MDISDQIAAVRRALNSYQFPQLLMTAQETGILHKLSQQPSSASELAEAIGGLDEPIRRLANALVAHNVLNLENNRYTIAEDWSVLRSNSPVTMAGYIGHMSLLKDRWAKLGQALCDENFSRESLTLIDGSNKQTTETFIAAMDEVAKPIATKLASNWNFDNHRIIDIGGGSGIYSIVVASTNKNVTGVVFDLPGVVEIAQKNITSAGLNEILTIASGDYNESIPGDGYDDAFLFAMVHRQDEAQNTSLLQRTFKSLNSGGRLFLIGFFTNEQGTGPVFSTHFAVEMTLMVPGGRVYSNTEIEKLIEGAGFIETERIDTIPGPATLYTAMRP